MAGIQTRDFGPDDTAQIWELFNEQKGWIQALIDSGGSARLWSGYPSAKTLGDGRNTSIKMSNRVEAVGDVAPTWNGDTFRLPAGRYRLDAQLTFEANSNGYRTMWLLRNPGITSFNSTSTPPGTFVRAVKVAATSSSTTVQMTKLLTVASTDVFMFTARQNTGGNLDIVDAPQDSELMIQRVGD